MVAVAAYDRMRETHVHDDSCCLTISIGKLQPALSLKLPRNLAEQTSTQFEVTPFPCEDGTGSVGVPDQPSQSQGQIRARTRRKNP
jgi:hypothetical protein